MNDERYFCPKPFEHMEISPGGDAYLCCSGWLDAPSGNVKKTAPEEVWNSAAAHELRASIHDQSFRHCTKCPFLADRLGPIKRIADLEADPGTPPQWLEWIRSKATTVERTHMLNVVYDQTCNLACPSCRVDYVIDTTAEYEEKKKMQDRVLPALLPTLEWLYVTGSGDPFASRLFRELLRELDASKYPQLKILLHTNAQLFTPENWEAMRSSAPAVHTVQVSIDASTPETYAVNRRGGEWNVLMENLTFISGLRAKGAIKQLEMSFVVQRNNWREMPDFVRLMKSMGGDCITFLPIADWYAMPKVEFYDRAIHRPQHPEHAEYKASLSDPCFADYRVVLGSVGDVVENSAREQFGDAKFIQREAEGRGLWNGLPGLAPAHTKWQ